uniref:Uncharacterized protein n=1 Tax=Plectus sambesii TaxID=2011161 RepID=A0A914URZ9_9BILA
MRSWLIFYLAAGVVSAIAPTWDVRCSKETDPIPCRVTEGKENRNDSVSVLLRPHDLRVEPRVKANPVDGGHWLETVLSWETPSQPLQNAKRVTGFQLAIAPLSGAKLNTRYFLFRIPDTVVFTNQFQRFAFTSRGLLQFGQSYEIGVWSLPMPSSIVSDLSLKKVVRMPRDPDSQFELLAPIDCRSKSHEDAARWVSGFRRLDLFVLRRELNVSFVAAPPQYCF